MREMRSIMGMPITVEIIDHDPSDTIELVFKYFHEIDERFSTYKDTSEISKINRGEIRESDWSNEMKDVFSLATLTKRESEGYFDIKRPDGMIDPSGIVKGLAIQRAGLLIYQAGFNNYYIDAGGDIESRGKNSQNEDWSVGIKNPFKQDEIVKVIYPKGHGVATSGSYIRGAHIYDPHDPTRALQKILSITIIGADVLEADRFATAAFAMQSNGIQFIEQTIGLEGYMIDRDGIATMTSGFERFTNI
jgi:thiamine biosynthesis lipoprotein